VDAFRMDAEIAFRRKARDYFARECGSTPPAVALIWRDLLTGPGKEGTPDSGGCSRLSKEILAVDEASCHAPRLGLELRRRRISSLKSDPQEKTLLRLAGMAGAASHAFAAGSSAARARGLFSSSLMGFRDVQERLAGLFTGAEVLRLGTLRACRLIGRSGAERAAAELEPLLERGLALTRQARALALDLLGEDWTREHLPEDGPASANERTER